MISDNGIRKNSQKSIRLISIFSEKFYLHAWKVQISWKNCIFYRSFFNKMEKTWKKMEILQILYHSSWWNKNLIKFVLIIIFRILAPSQVIEAPFFYISPLVTSCMPNLSLCKFLVKFIQIRAFHRTFYTFYSKGYKNKIS